MERYEVLVYTEAVVKIGEIMATASEFTRIASLEVDGQSIWAVLDSYNTVSPNFEIKLDTWSTWQRWTNPVVLGNIAPGQRTLYARSYNKKGRVDISPASKQFTIAEVVTPPPVTELPLIKAFPKVENWNSRLIEGTTTGRITNESDGSIRFYAGNGPIERVEVQATGSVGLIPSERIYDWSLYVPKSVVLSNNDWYHTLAQTHGNNQAGYTGGVGVTPAGKDPKGEGKERLMLRLAGGKVTNPAGNRSYEYENDIPLIPFTRDSWINVRYHVRWSKLKDGFAKFYVNGQQLVNISNIPTASEWASGQMIRCGWYPQTQATYDMKIKNYKVYGR